MIRQFWMSCLLTLAGLPLAAQTYSAPGTRATRIPIARPDPTSTGARLDLVRLDELPAPQSWDYVWASPGIGMERTLSGQRLLAPSGAPPVVKVHGVPATIVNATATAVRFQVPNLGPGFAGGPVQVSVEHSGGSAVAPTPLILVTGPPVITSLSTTFIPLGTITTVTVMGNNLANVDGICLPGTPRFLPRTAPPSSNDRFQVHFQFPGPMDGPVRAAWGPASTPTCMGNPTPVNLQVR
ncbi:MAG TPA: hypothetical protein VG500_11710 [Gemmatimonadales bacterium]|jgi:hypothetical protein|nr:hypothetical protein [Gemmatimonadales bacterium]